MTKQTEAQRLAAYLDAMALDPALCHHKAFTIVEKAAAELRRLEQSSREGWRHSDELEQERKRLESDKDDWKDASFVFKERAVKAEAHIAELEAANAELLAVLGDVWYALEKARIWGGMEWKYNPLHPVHYLPARDKARAAIAKHGGAA